MPKGKAKYPKRSRRKSASLLRDVGTYDVGETFVSLQTLTATLATKKSLFFRGDAFDLIDLLPEASIDLIITSPPYWGHRTYGQDHNWEILKEWKEAAHHVDETPAYDWYRSHGGALGLEPLPEWYVAHLLELLRKTRRPLKKTGSVWINIGDTYFARWSSIRERGRQGLGNTDRFRRKTPMGGFRQEKQLLLIPARFAIAMQAERWILRNDLIWHKPNIPPRPEKDRLRLAHEHVFHFVHRPSAGRATYYYDSSKAEKHAVDVVTHKVRPGEPGHSASFPLELLYPRIETSCPPNGTVLDPFCGTGRAILAARQLGRHAIGFDTVEKFLDTGRGLLKQGNLEIA